MAVDGRWRLNGLMTLRGQILVECVGALAQAEDFVLQALQIVELALAVDGGLKGRCSGVEVLPRLL